MNDEHDSKLQRRFDQWREKEHAQAPDFDRVWRRAEREAEAPARPAMLGGWLRFASVGAAVAVVAGAAWFAFRDNSRQGPVVTANEWDNLLATIQDELAAPEPPAWSAPTDYLLADAGSGLDANWSKP
ncbi:MAG: hypothetical protein L0Z50_34380 [Verrucomicrobiales bacterium]|nr:hypothetical protein [Verrucomicrobiales bacterium]